MFTLAFNLAFNPVFKIVIADPQGRVYEFRILKEEADPVIDAGLLEMIRLFETAQTYSELQGIPAPLALVGHRRNIEFWISKEGV